MTSPLVLSLAGVAVVTALFTVPAVRGSRAGVPASLSCRELRGGACRTGPPRHGRGSPREPRTGSAPADRPAGDRAGRSGSPVMVTSTDAASAASGMPVAVPPTPDYLTLSSIKVSGMRAARITMDTTRFEQVLNALGITDIALPPELNGRAVTIEVPPMVEIECERGSDPTEASHRRVEFVQVRSRSSRCRKALIWQLSARSDCASRHRCCRSETHRAADRLEHDARRPVSVRRGLLPADHGPWWCRSGSRDRAA